MRQYLSENIILRISNAFFYQTVVTNLLYGDIMKASLQRLGVPFLTRIRENILNPLIAKICLHSYQSYASF